MKLKLLLLFTISISYISLSQTKFSGAKLDAKIEVDNIDMLSNSFAEIVGGVKFKKGYNRKTSSLKSSLTTTIIPDANFEQALIDLGIDSDGVINQQILTADAESVLELDIQSKKISDLRGIEAFINLTLLYCWDNDLTSLDISQNVNLESLGCARNKLSSLDVTNNIALKILSCSQNSITNIDVSKNKGLITFWCDYNQISILDVSNNPLLYDFNCLNNQLTALDVSNNTSLFYFWCQRNQLTSINLGINTILRYFNCSFNQLSNIDLSQTPTISQLDCNDNLLTSLDLTYNSNLVFLVCSNNKLKALDVTNCPNLAQLNCSFNQISSIDMSISNSLNAFSKINCSYNTLNYLNIKNGKNHLVTEFDVSNNNLYCIQVDDVDYSNSNWTNKDSFSSFSMDCSSDDDNDSVINSDDKCANTPSGETVDTDGCSNNQNNVDDDRDGITNKNDACANTPIGDLVNDQGCSIVVIPDANFEKALIDLGIDSDGVINQEVLIIDVTSITDLQLFRTNITNLSGIEAFLSLTKLTIFYNEITAIDVSNNIALQELAIEHSLLQNIDISANINLIKLNLNNNKISSIDVSNNRLLTSLQVSVNEILNLDVSKNINLTVLTAFMNPLLEKLNIKNGNNTLITTFYANYNPKLNCIQVDDSNYSINNWKDIDAHTSFSEDCEDDTDDDKDGIINISDLCPNTSTQETVDANGCSESQKDDDNDGVMNNADMCANTPNGETVDANGCSESQKDDDNDGVADKIDICPNTPTGETVDANGCSESQKDDDNDGVMNNADMCANTPNGETVDANGCSESQKDDDNDGVKNNKDQCANTISGAMVNAQGCFILPSNNFNIETIGETCPDKDNAKIIITTKETYNYITTINGVAYNFTDNVTVSNLPPGNYEFCISISADNFEQCFNIELSEGTTIAGKSSVSNGKSTFTIDSGTAPYTVEVNNMVVLQTLSKSFSIDVNNGDAVEIKTSKACEGKLSKKIMMLDAVFAYPNPSTGAFEIALSFSKKEVNIEVYSIQSQLLSSALYPITNGKVNLDISNRPNGVYFVKISLDKIVMLKVIKQ